MPQLPNNIVRWYLMIYPYGRKGLSLGLQREKQRRIRANEPAIDYFAPQYVEAKRVDGKMVKTEKQLFFNYLFVRSSVKEIFRMKQFEDQYNFPPRELDDKGKASYPYISDAMMTKLKWIAKSYAGVIPVCTDDSFHLIKGDRILITAGSFKGIEARLYEDRKTGSKDIMVAVDGWMTIPLLKVKDNEYRLIALSERVSEKDDIQISDELLPRLHDILCRKLSGSLTLEDEQFAQSTLSQFTGKEPASGIQRCKHYSILLIVNTILDNSDTLKRLIASIHNILPIITAAQSKALLLTTMYACTDNSQYYNQAHELIDPWSSDTTPKKSKQQLIDQLSAYDRLLGH